MSISPSRLVVPFSVTVEPIARMLNFEIADDPTYSGLEIQGLDDGIHGTGIVVLLSRKADRLVDVYRQAGLRLDPTTYGIGAGLGEWREAEFEPGRLEVTPNGAAAEVAFRDAAGRRIEVRIDDRDGRRRAPAALLAPFGAAIERPEAMLLVWMNRFDLLRTSGRPPEIRIDGRRVETGRLPGAFLHRRHLIKYAAELAVVRLNHSSEGIATTVDPGHPGEPGGIEIVQDAGEAGIAAIGASSEGHRARLELRPPFPDIERLEDGRVVTGTWRLAIDRAPSIVSGTWRARRDGGSVSVEMDSTAEWKPGRLPLLMRIVTRIVPTFRTWPQTYRWHATVALGSEPTISSGWERTSGARDESYSGLMGLSKS